MGRRLALLIGNSNYDDPAFPALVKAEADIHAMAGVLGDQNIGGFEVTLLINEAVETIRQKIAGFFHQAKKDDILLLYFSGHGDVWNKSRYLYLMGKDTKPGLFAAMAISSSFIKEVMDLSKSKTQILILDCCYSGAFVQGIKGNPHIGEETASLFAGSGRAVLAASSATQTAWEGDDTMPLSLFTHYLVQGLTTGEADRNKRGQITLDEWYDYAYKGVINETTEQTPSKSIENQQGSIVIAKNPTLGLGHSKTPTIDLIGIDLTAAVRVGTLDPVFGRYQEIERAFQILSRRNKNNLILIGESGVGKTAIVKSLAQRLIAGEVPELLVGKRLLTLDVDALVASAQSPNEREELLKKIIEETYSSRNEILVIENISSLLGAGAIESVGNAVQLFKLALSRRELTLCIGTSTPEAYGDLIKQDKMLRTWFEEVVVREPTIEETLEILKGIRERYEEHHRLIITDEALKAATEMASRYITDRFMPNKAIDLIDETASRVRMQNSLASLYLKEAKKVLELVLREKEAAIQQQEYELAAELRDREVKLRDRIAKLESGWPLERASEKPAVGEEEIAQIVSMWTGIPVMHMMRTAQEESQRLLQMEDALHARVIGQNEAIEKIARAVRRAHAGLRDPKLPIGSFIFMGPRGVGKTELAKALAEFMFGSEEALIKIDMVEFMERHAATRLVGAPPGYVGYEEGGQLTEAVRRKPYSVILLDGIEMAHPDVLNMLLPILKDGKLTDAKGRTVDFRNTIVIMTARVGLVLLNKEAALSFEQYKDKAKVNQAEYKAMKDRVLGELKNSFRPEFLNRIDEVIVFHSLCIEEMYSIVELLLKRARTQLTEQQLELVVPQVVKDFLIEKDFDALYGAHPLRHTIQRMVEDPLAEGLLQGTFHPGDLVEAMVYDDDLHLQVHDHIELLPPDLPKEG